MNWLILVYLLSESELLVGLLAIDSISREYFDLLSILLAENWGKHVKFP